LEKAILRALALSRKFGVKTPQPTKKNGDFTVA
jgi:hypothetical protein